MASPSPRKLTSRHRLLSKTALACAGLAAAASVLTACSSSPAVPQSTVPTPQRVASFPAPADAVRTCGRPVLDSPFSYDGRAGSYRSGKAGLPSYGGPGTDFPHAHAGMVLATGVNNYLSYQLRPDTVYYFLPGLHTGQLQADTGDAFVGGRAHGEVATLSGEYKSHDWAIDSNSTDGDQSGVTVEYLTVEKYQPNGNSAAINPDSNTGWTIAYNTVTQNVPGAGVILGASNELKDNCLTLNGQYGFQAEDSDSWGMDSLTGGPYNLTVSGNEISYNDTCDYSGLLDNAKVGWTKYNPVPARYRNSHCGQVTGDGDQGGFKLWHTNGVTIKDNYVHNNWGVGGWADTDNANTTWTGNTFTDNEASAITEEISYNFSITDNYIAGNDITDGLANNAFPSPAIYISESGSDREFGGVPACPEASCSAQPSYPGQSVISANTLVDNGGNIFLWQNSNRYCSGPDDDACTLVDGGPAGPFSMKSCAANLPSASVSTSSYTGARTGTPTQDWWDGCLWKTENVAVSHNSIYFAPADILGCNNSAWPDCGAGGIFSEYGANPSRSPAWVIATDLTFYQGNLWSANTYVGPSTFYAWSQSNNDNPVSWADWTGAVSGGGKCGSAGNRGSGACTGPFGQDAHSVYRAALPGSK